MGDFTEHIFFGLLIASLTAYFTDAWLQISVSETVVSVIAVIAGSVIPDIDHENSYVHRSVKAFASISAGLIVAVLAEAAVHLKFLSGVVVFLATYLLVSALKPRHRSYFHTISFCVSAASIATLASIYLFSSPVPGVAFGVGTGSHLLLDGEFQL